MTLPSVESIFLILSAAVLAASVLYWFWSHIQLTQKKVQLLENAVFELRGMLSSPTSEVAPAPAPAPASEQVVYKEMEEEDWPVASTRLDDLVSEDLQPGGGAVVGSPENTEGEKFRELFIQHESRSPKVVEPVITSESLDSMPVKELRRLAEQRGIAGVSDLKKKELLTALRQQVAPVAVERTLDLTEPVVEEEETKTETLE
jgi:hypothetical protein